MGDAQSTGSRDLHPPIEPYATGMLEVGDGHRLHYELSGNPHGRTVLFLHGGPGSGCKPEHRRFFDPRRWRIVLFDQRGAGLSTPSGSLVANTTQHLVADIERLREHLGIARWVVFGGSWGSTLGLAYAAAHPGACAGLILRGIWLARRRDIDWWMRGVRRIFPEYWEEFVGHLAPGGASTRSSPRCARPPATSRRRDRARSPSRASSSIMCVTRPSWPKASCCAASTASAMSRGSSCMGAMT